MDDLRDRLRKIVSDELLHNMRHIGEQSNAIVDAVLAVLVPAGWCDPSVPGVPIVAPLGHGRTHPWSPVYRIAAPMPQEDEHDPACVARWPDCEEGTYDPRCCRFPKSCSPRSSH